MLIGILVAIIAIIVLSGVAIFLYITVTNQKTKKMNSSKQSQVKSVDTVGVAPEDHLNPDARVGLKEENENIDPYKHLRSRFRAVGIFVAAAFSILGAKIFSMQVLSGDKFKQMANANATISIKTPAPRGNIFDTTGKVLVKNRTCLTVVAEGDVGSDHNIVSRLSVVLGLPYEVVRNRILDQSLGAQSRRVIASDITKKQAAYISEHGSAFSGVSIESRTIRSYPYGALCAHVLGYTGEISSQELYEKKEGRDLQAGDIVGKSGIESYYDNVLSGDHGERVVVSDADGNVVQIKSEISSSKGSDLHLTINAAVQYFTDDLLQKSIAPDGVLGTGCGSAGSVVVMDVEDGSIIAMSNCPTYKPGIFTNGISIDTWNLYNTETSHYPLLNRAISGTYPAASTFKAFTGLAALEVGAASAGQYWNCKGEWDGWDSGLKQKCWLHSGHGSIGFHKGIVESCDVVFYEIGKYFFDNKDKLGESAMQDWIKKYNFGRATGIDLDGEEFGRVPTPEWKKEYFKDVPNEADWVGGDNANMAIGQGYVLITPLQLAVAYGAIATGKLMTPHLLKEVKNGVGDVVAKYDTKEIGQPDVDLHNLKIIQDALHGVGIENSGVATFCKQANLDCAIKTGTAEVAGKRDFAWTACYGPFDNPKYVVTCIVEEGGGGSSSATPIATKVLKAAIDAKNGVLPDNVGYIQGSTGKSVKISQKSQRTD